MNKIKSIALGVVVSLATATAIAAPYQGSNRGGYVGMSIGNAELDSADGSGSYDDINLRAYLGYQLNQYFAIEGGFSSMPFDDVLGDVADLTGVDITLLGKLPVTQKMSAYAKLGYWDWDVSVPYYGTYYDLFGGSDMLYGIGFEYKFTPRLSMNIDAIRYEAEDADIDTLNASLSYRF